MARRPCGGWGRSWVLVSAASFAAASCAGSSTRHDSGPMSETGGSMGDDDGAASPGGSAGSAASGGSVAGSGAGGRDSHGGEGGVGHAGAGGEGEGWGSGAGGFTDGGPAGAAGTAGSDDSLGGAAGVGPEPESLVAYVDGETLDVRLRGVNAPKFVEWRVERGGEVIPDAPRRYVSWDSNDALPSFSVYLDPVNTVRLDPCTFVEHDADEQTLRMLVPLAYAFETRELRVSLDVVSGKPDVTPVLVDELPPFDGLPLGCEPTLDIAFGSERYREVLAFPSLSLSTSVCALTEEGEARCFGSSGQLLGVPVGPFEGLGLAAGNRVCGRRASGAVDCFALDGAGDLDPGVVPDRSYRRLSRYGGCGVLDTGSLHCLGDFAGDAASWERAGDYVAVSGGYQVGCAVSAAAALECWGFDLDEMPRVELLSGRYRDVAVGSGSVCALTDTGGVDCATTYDSSVLRLHGSDYVWVGGAWGLAAVDALGVAVTFGRSGAAPQLGFREVVEGEWVSPPCGLLLDGRLACWKADAFTLP